MFNPFGILHPLNSLKGLNVAIEPLRGWGLIFYIVTAFHAELLKFSPFAILHYSIA